jgi:hypothetical protein
MLDQLLEHADVVTVDVELGPPARDEPVVRGAAHVGGTLGPDISRPQWPSAPDGSEQK